ncbi:MAG TPA: hypothetical protein VEK11_26185 [Thermoanaerobaculia bacterium]|nr:hypothetical protein [Thermoanaerobaculia bacterium]
MANYLIAVGGTGQHVALAVADLVALAYEIFSTPDEFPAVHLILVDADQAADTDQPSAWQEARRRLQALGLLTGDSFECVPLPVSSNLSGTRRMYEFVNRLGSSFGANAADALLLSEQREVDVTTGFYAQPRVGAMMAEWLFGEVTRGEAVNPALARIFALAGDPANRIVVAGSGVGGTGAGFAPALVRRLSATGGGARLMALMATEWFRLAGACSSRLSESVQKSNANSALWHAAHSGSAAGVRTILFGHPHVSRAPEEECQSGAFQVRKKNLTIPYYAAAAAMSFFAGDANGGTHVPAAATAGDVVTLPTTLRITPRLTLHDLVQSNVEAVGRLTLASEYLRGRYSGFVLPLSSLAGRIDALDATDRQRLEGPLAAKRAALENLGVSDEKLPVVPRTHRGLATLRGWISGKVDRPRDLWETVPVVPAETTVRKAEVVAADNGTAALLIRKIGYSGRVTGGNLVPITHAQVRDLVTVDDVDVSKVPASDAVTLTLADIFMNWEARNGEEKNDIARLLVQDRQLARPVLVCGDKGDRPREWLKRWLLLTNLLTQGKLTVEQKALPFTTGKVLSFRGVPVGELSRDFVCVPLVNGHWNDEAFVSALWGAGTRLEMLATWCRNTATVALCRSAKLPAWLEVLLHATSPFAGVEKQYTTQTVATRWTDGDVLLPLPNAAAGDAGAKDCVAATAEAFGVFGSQPQLTEMSAPVRAVVLELATKALTVPSLNGTPSKTVVFSETLSPAAYDCLFGEVVVDVGARRVWPLESTHRIVTSIAGELFTPNVGCFRNEQRTRWLTPVRREYIPLLSSGAINVRSEEHGQELRVIVSVHGRTFAETYSASRVRALNPLLLHWPKAVADAASSVTVLFDVLERRYSQQGVHVVLHDREGKSWTLSPLLNERHSLHYVAADAKVPHSLSFELEQKDVGFTRIDRTVQHLDDGSQRVAVDFGTSATVVAIDKNGGSEILDLLGERADATEELWKGNDLTSFQWYGTRSLDPTIREKRRAPSALVFLGSAKEARPVQPVYGDHVLLDQDDWQWKNGDASLLFDIKWTRERAYRETFLIHHLEQCIAAALSKGILQSRRLRVIFTMPLRQRARAEAFADEIAVVVKALQRRTGIEIEPRFAYESEVIAPEGAPRGDVDAVLIADLGGGTLDLFARYFGSDRREGANDVVFDSARIGGHSLVEWLTRNLDGAHLAEYRRRLRVGAAEQLDEESARVAREYFDVVKRFTALWMDSVWRYWTGGERSARVHVQLLGMGWSLPSSPGDQMALHLTDIAASTGSRLTFSKYDDPVLPSNPKELLARRALFHPGAAREQFITFQPASINGIEISIAGDVRRDEEALRGLGASTPAVSITAAGLDRIRKLTGAREEVVATVRDATRMTLTTRSTGADKHDGAVLEGPNVWVASPLAIAAEMYTRQVLLHVNV